MFPVQLPLKIAVALIGAIGDVILSTPLVEAIRDAYPSAHLTYLVGEKSAPVLEHLSIIDELYVMPEFASPRIFPSLRLLADMRRHHFDLSVCLSRSDTLSLAFWFAGVSRRLGYLPLRTAWTLTDRIDSTADIHSTQHRTEYFLAAANVLGIPHPDRVRLHYNVTSTEMASSERLLGGMGVDWRSATLVAIHPGTSKVSIEKRRWHEDGFTDVARYLVATGRKPILIGGPDEVEVCSRIAAKLGSQTVDLSGKLDLRQLAAVIKHCRVLIHNDSSPLHLAGAIGVPVVTIFGYQNSRLWGPLDPRSVVVRRDLPCSPCEQSFVCERSFECVRQLPSSDVIQAVESVLRQSAGTPLWT